MFDDRFSFNSFLFSFFFLYLLIVLLFLVYYLSINCALSLHLPLVSFFIHRTFLLVDSLPLKSQQKKENIGKELILIIHRKIMQIIHLKVTNHLNIKSQQVKSQ